MAECMCDVWERWWRCVLVWCVNLPCCTMYVRHQGNDLKRELDIPFLVQNSIYRILWKHYSKHYLSNNFKLNAAVHSFIVCRSRCDSKQRSLIYMNIEQCAFIAFASTCTATQANNRTSIYSYVSSSNSRKSFRAYGQYNTCEYSCSPHPTEPVEDRSYVHDIQSMKHFNRVTSISVI